MSITPNIARTLKDSKFFYYSVATHIKFIPFHQRIKMKSRHSANIKAFYTQLKEGNK